MTLSFFSKAAGKLHWLNRSWVPTSPTSGTSGHTTLLRRLRHTTYSCWWWCCRDVLALSTTCALTQKRRTIIIMLIRQSRLLSWDLVTWSSSWFLAAVFGIAAQEEVKSCNILPRRPRHRPFSSSFYHNWGSNSL